MPRKPRKQTDDMVTSAPPPHTNSMGVTQSTLSRQPARRLDYRTSRQAAVPGQSKHGQGSANREAVQHQLHSIALSGQHEPNPRQVLFSSIIWGRSHKI